ncbi:DUF92 domain-containing protein [Halorarius halobius]|uniref:DUF92 domain-containing protein n=1 Tax=Halorarius halobius TaxID=2962671 RepID=UPI0020CCA8D6|nr:DUF92 domain-containing protein [Halorarius halobius]
MNGNLGRAGLFAVVGALALVVPALGGRPTPRTAAVLSAVPFAVVAGLGLFVVDRDSRAFELFASPGDYEEGRLFSLAGFALAAAGLAILASRFGLPSYVYVGTVFVLTGGNLAAELSKRVSADTFVTTSAFAVGGFLAGLFGEGLALLAGATGGGLRLYDHVVSATGLGANVAWPTVLAALAFLAAAGAIAAALLRSMLLQRDDPLVMVSVALLLWLFVGLDVAVPPQRLLVGLLVTVLLGYLAYSLGTASVPGMLTGVLLALLAVVLGGYGWFALLLTFFGVGGLSSKFRYEEKRERGIAEDNEGARGSGNVLANSAAALAAVLAFAASDTVGVAPELARFAFAGAVATALADTLSSEFGGLFDDPRLVTTFERVEPGTDGAVTWQGELAGLVGAGVIAGIAAVFFDLGPLPTLAIVGGGFVGMTVDSVLGATVEGGMLGNQAVNLLATLGGAVGCTLFALLV